MAKKRSQNYSYSHRQWRPRVVCYATQEESLHNAWSYQSLEATMHICTDTLREHIANFILEPLWPKSWPCRGSWLRSGRRLYLQATSWLPNTWEIPSYINRFLGSLHIPVPGCCVFLLKKKKNTQKTKKNQKPKKPQRPISERLFPHLSAHSWSEGRQ